MSFSVCKDFRFAAAHQIRGHRGGCENLHGHSYRVRVWVQASELDALGMVVDFADLARVMGEVVGPFDHRFLNEVPPFDQRNTTAELLAQHVFLELRARLEDRRLRVARVEVWESESAGAVYEEGGSVLAAQPVSVALAPEETPAVFRLPPEERLKVNEIFYSLQGESTRVGLPCVLVRLTGCHLRCRWCDTAYAFYEGEWLARDEVLARVAAFGCPLVELTGGEPLLQPGALPLLAALCDAGYEVLVETSGAVDIAAVDPRVRRIVDVKCPGSGEADRNLWSNLDALRPTDELKLVLAGEADYRWASDLVRERQLHRRCPVHFSPVAGELEPALLAEWILRDRLPVRLQLQLHKLLWGAARGV